MGEDERAISAESLKRSLFADPIAVETVEDGLEVARANTDKSLNSSGDWRVGETVILGGRVG